MKKIYLIIPVLVLCCTDLFAQCETMSEKELRELGPWICPGYVPSPGFPGSGVPAQLPEVPISGNSGNSDDGDPNVGFFPVYFPAVPPQGGGSVPPQQSSPCAGDPVPNPKIAPSSPGNYNGGTYGYTRNGGNKLHDGIDIASPVNSDLYSMFDGVVTDKRDTFSPGQYAKKQLWQLCDC